MESEYKTEFTIGSIKFEGWKANVALYAVIFLFFGVSFYSGYLFGVN